LESGLSIEEKELDAIRDGLKGFCFVKTLLTTAKTQGFTNQIEKKQKSLEPWTAQINEKQAAIALTQSELDLIREKESQSLKAVEEVSAKLKSLATDKAAKESELKQSQREIGTIEKQTQDAIAQLKQCQQKGAKIYESLSQSRAKADEAKASLSASQTQGQVLTSLTRLRDSGRVQGFHVLPIPRTALTSGPSWKSRNN
jgi:structural maintenance of chromosome 4